MIGMAGAAIDYSRASAARTAMQATLDSATLMVAKEAQTIPPTQVTSVDTTNFNAASARPGQLGPNQLPQRGIRPARRTESPGHREHRQRPERRHHGHGFGARLRL